MLLHESLSAHPVSVLPVLTASEPLWRVARSVAAQVIAVAPRVVARKKKAPLEGRRLNE